MPITNDDAGGRSSGSADGEVCDCMVCADRIDDRQLRLEPGSERCLDPIAGSATEPHDTNRDVVNRDAADPSRRAGAHRSPRVRTL